MHPCCNFVGKLKGSLAQVCGSFPWSVSPKLGVCRAWNGRVSEGTAGLGELWGMWRSRGKTLGEAVSEDNCEY